MEVSLLANIKSAKKRIKTSRYRAQLNKSKKTEIKTYINRFNDAIENNNIEEAQELLKIVDKKLKRAAHENIIHENAVARQISSLTKKLNNAG